MDIEKDTWHIIDSYFKTNPDYIAKHHLDSYNEFTDNKIEQIVKQSNPLVIFNNYDEITN